MSPFDRRGRRTARGLALGVLLTLLIGTLAPSGPSGHASARSASNGPVALTGSGSRGLPGAFVASVGVRSLALDPVCAQDPSLLVNLVGGVAGGTPPYRYEWNFGDGTNESGGPTATHLYRVSGFYLVELTITDVNGTSELATQPIAPPQPASCASRMDPVSSVVSPGGLMALLGILTAVAAVYTILFRWPPRRPPFHAVRVSRSDPEVVAVRSRRALPAPHRPGRPVRAGGGRPPGPAETSRGSARRTSS
jgi:hypothetical protein